MVHQAKSGAVVHKIMFPGRNWQPFPGREPVNVLWQGTGKRPRQGLASIPRQGTGKRPRQGLQTFPGRELVTVPRQGIGKRAQAGHQQASQAGTGKRSQAGNWQAYPGRVLASVPGRDCKCSQAGNRRRPRQWTVAVPRQGTVGHARIMHSNDLPPTPPSATPPANQLCICVMSLHGNGTRGFS